MNITKLSLIAAFLSAITVGQAQKSDDTSAAESGKHEYSIYATVGLSNLSYKPSGNGEKNAGFGNGAGLEYTFNVSGSFGVSAGAEFSSFAGKTSFKTLSEEYPGTDDNGDPVKYSYTVDNFTEVQTLWLVSVPITVRYKTPVGGKTQFYVGGGIKLGFPASTKASIAAGMVTSSGFYDYEQVRYTDLPVHGFFDGDKPNEKTSKIDAGFATMLTLESGLRFDIGKNALYMGVYFDYSLNSLKKSNDKHPLNYNRELTYESILNSALTDKLNLISIGVKLKFSLFN